MISVVIPLYNKQNSIVETINCVKRQTYRNFECIIVDDGSTDYSVQNAYNAIGEDKRFTLYHQRNEGVSAARNFGIKLSKYNYVAFLDADDYWEKEYLEEVVELIYRFPECVLLGVGWTYKDFFSSTTLHNIKKSVFKRVSIENFWNQSEYTYWTSACVCRKEAVTAIGGFDKRISYGEDIDLWYRLALAYPSCAAYSTKVLSYWVQDSENRLFLSLPVFNRNLVCFMNKYDEEMEINFEFKKFVTPKMAWLLCPYLDSKEYRDSKLLRLRIRILRSKLDLHLLKPRIIFRLYFPRMFHIYWFIKHRLL